MSDHVTVGNAKITNSSSVRNLGAWFDSSLTMHTHIAKICSSGFYYIHNIRRIRKYLSVETTKTLINDLVTSRLDYCNSLLYGSSNNLTDKLQRLQNCAARLISNTPKFSHITPVLYELHWLPVKARIHFKIILLTFKAIRGSAPIYLQNLLIRKRRNQHYLRSAEDGLLLERHRGKTLATLGDFIFFIFF